MIKSLYALIVLAVAALAGPTSPPRLSFATYVGDPSGAVLYGLAVDQSGYAYASGAYSGCGFLTKLNQRGSGAVWSVCLPVTQVNAIALDTLGYIYIAGANQPFGATFVGTSTLMKVSPDTRQIVYSTSISGTYASRLVLDRTGNVYVTGLADSTFKSTPGAYLTTAGGPLAGLNAFAVKLNTSGMVQYATYLDFVQYPGGGTTDIAVDSIGQAWIVGKTCPIVGGTDCDVRRSGNASAIRKLDVRGATLLVKKTFGGGPGPAGYPFRDTALGVAVDSTDSAWVVGTTETNQVPTTPNSLEPSRPQTFPPGGGVGYAVKLSPAGDLLYGTYVGANSGEEDLTIDSVALDDRGRPYFALNFRSTATVMALSADGSALLLSTGLNSPVQAIALDGKGGVYTSGITSTLAFLTTPGSYEPVYPGGPSSGYVAKFDLTAIAVSQFSSLVNAASLRLGYQGEGTVAPGEIVTLTGKNFPPEPKVAFDGRQAPILYADANQINTVVPFEVSPPGTVVSIDGADWPVTLPVGPAVPGIFISNQGGNGQIAALNEDGSVNSNNNPAKAGSVVSVYMTGLGAMTPSIGDGQLGPFQPPFPTPVLGVSARVNGVDAPVLFVGQAPGLVAGAVQVNLRVPLGTAGGNAGLVVYVGNYQSQIGPTIIAVQ